MSDIRWIFLFFPILVLACNTPAPTPDRDTVKRISGKTMGTQYHVTLVDTTDRDWKPELDTLLKSINAEVSTWIPTSTISRFNQADRVFVLDYNIEAVLSSSRQKIQAAKQENKHFLANLIASQFIYKQTGGAFDPTVMPLVNYWGFGYTGRDPITAVDSTKVDSLRQFVGFDRVLEIQLDTNSQILKKYPGVQLDFSAIAKGHGVDILGFWLEDQGVSHYLVEIGGEVRARGKKPDGSDWTVGINTPREGAAIDDFQAIVALPNISLATSGNYRNFYESGGRKYAHTIHPQTGFPEINPLLSASLFAPNCRDADAYATACMVLGWEKARELVERVPDLEAYFVYGKQDGSLGTWKSSGLEKRVAFK